MQFLTAWKEERRKRRKTTKNMTTLCCNVRLEATVYFMYNRLLFSLFWKYNLKVWILNIFCNCFSSLDWCHHFSHDKLVAIISFFSSQTFAFMVPSMMLISNCIIYYMSLCVNPLTKGWLRRKLWILVAWMLKKKIPYILAYKSQNLRQKLDLKVGGATCTRVIK